MTNTEIWMWLSLHFGAGTNLYQRLFSHFGSIQAIYDCDDADVNLINWLKDFQKRKLLDKNTDHAFEVLEWCKRFGISVVTPSDDEYPFPLRALDNYPAVLYYRGTLPDFETELCISVVGTRTMSVNGQKNAYELGYGLAKGGAIVVSGMAKGIDSVAQKGALYAGGSSIAVLGNGIDVVYPKENGPLMEKLMRVGAVITEYPPHTPPIGTNFPIRNRLISALSVATVVVEADQNSGALITADKAKRQGKVVFAYPGPVNFHYSKGTNELIANGARVATAAIDVLENFMDKFKVNLSASKLKPVFDRNPYDSSEERKEDSFFAKIREARKIKKQEETVNETEEQLFDTSKLTEKEKLIYDSFEFNKPNSLNDISTIDLQLSEIASILTMLEIKGAIQNAPGGYYIKK